MEKQIDNIKTFWNEQANKYAGSSLATSPDSVAFELELAQMKSWIPSGSKLLDVGCGNGIKGLELVKSLEIEYYGIDYSEEMICQAKQLISNNNEQLKGKIYFSVADILDKNSIPYNDFDIVMSDRCLINLISLENQIIAIHNIYSLLREKGIYLMLENSIQALRNINLVRKKFDLPDIQVRWHNKYIDEEQLFSSVVSYFKVREVVSFASTYYLISRTLNALLTPNGENINYLSELNILASKLPPLGDFSPIKIFVLDKV